MEFLSFKITFVCFVYSPRIIALYLGEMLISFRLSPHYDGKNADFVPLIIYQQTKKGISHV